MATLITPMIRKEGLIDEKTVTLHYVVMYDAWLVDGHVNDYGYHAPFFNLFMFFLSKKEGHDSGVRNQSREQRYITVGRIFRTWS